MNPFLIPLTPCSQQDPFLVCKPSPSTSPNTPVQKVKSSPPPSVAFVSYFKGPFISITYTNDNTMHRFKLLPSSAWNYQVPHDTSNSKYFGENLLPDNHCVCTPILTLMCWISHALQPCMLSHQLHLCDKLNCLNLSLSHHVSYRCSDLIPHGGSVCSPAWPLTRRWDRGRAVQIIPETRPQGVFRSVLLEPAGITFICSSVPCLFVFCHDKCQKKRKKRQELRNRN